MGNEDETRRRQWIDRDLVTIAMSWGMSPTKAATEIVEKVDYEVGEKGIARVTYGSLSSPTGESFLRRFVQDIIEQNPETFNDELYARAKRGGAIVRDDAPKQTPISPERLAEIKAKVRSDF